MINRIIKSFAVEKDNEKILHLFVVSKLMFLKLLTHTKPICHNNIISKSDVLYVNQLWAEKQVLGCILPFQ